ncbi:VOC family protein [Massilia sp. PAMC28688]|uniref:VOC family protein n=1 Tax=Massilia sp. PAMC28688 TaxID=2861283 RepID=UPI001C62C46C|nr:VOC family protein [Massilia sp. PAMC28688]QYF94309.1 VOC family protein [Massilia sp. PAMC28688]
MSRAVHFEIHASNPQTLIDFYSGLFGWTFNRWEGGEYWMIQTGADDQRGINGGLMPRRGDLPHATAAINAFVITVDVDQLDPVVDKATASGGSVALPRMPVPGIGWLAYLKDPDGNIFGVMQSDPEAA